MTSLRFSNERGKFTPVQKNKGAFKRLFFFLTNIHFPLRHPSLWWKCPYRFKNNTKILFSLRINFSLLHILHARVFLKTQSKRKKERNVLMIHLNYWDTKPHIFQQNGVFVSFPFFKGIKWAPRNTRMCNCQLFQSNKRQQLNNLKIISNKQ